MEVRKIMSEVQEILYSNSWCYHVIEGNGKLQQPNPGRMTKGTDPSEMKVWVTSPRKEARPAEDGRNTEWVVEEGSYKCQLSSCEQLQK